MRLRHNGRVDAAAVNHVTDKLSITDYVIPLASNDLLCPSSTRSWKKCPDTSG